MCFSHRKITHCAIVSIALGARTPLAPIDQPDKARYPAEKSGRNNVVAMDLKDVQVSS